MKRFLTIIAGALVLLTSSIEAHKEKNYIQLNQLEIHAGGMFWIEPTTGAVWELDTLCKDHKGYYVSGVELDLYNPWPATWQPFYCKKCNFLNKASTPKIGCAECGYQDLNS